MIIAFAYFLIILFLIYKNGLFGIFKDNKISNFQFALFFALKCIAIPIFYWIYVTYYGGMERCDAGLFFKDSKIINSIASEHFGEYLKVMFGLQDDSPGSFLYTNYISKTANWDEGRSWRLFFNDNKSIIRIHSVIHFISFNSYYVHALFSCLFGYVGINFIYRSLKHLFISKEIWVMSAFIFLPNLWLFTGALLKEPIVLFNMGIIFYLTDQCFKSNCSSLKKLFYVILILFFAYYLKPQITFTVFILYFIYRSVNFKTFKHKSVAYLCSLSIVIVFVNFTFLFFKNVSLLTFINTKQAEFYDVMKGGIFLKDETKFVRLNFNKDLIIGDILKDKKSIKIKKGVPFYYWEDTHQQDMLFCKSNEDTLTNYTEIYSLSPAHSGFPMATLHKNIGSAWTLCKGFAYALFYPIKFNSFINVIVSFENIFLIICFMITIFGIIFRRERLHLLFFLSLVVLLMILFGISTPNTGAIVRYRSIIIPFLVLAALYTLNQKNETGKIR